MRQAAGEESNKFKLRSEQGFSILEVLIASAILIVFGFFISRGIADNIEVRGRIQQQQEFLQIENALRGVVFKKVSEFIESKPNCKDPGKEFLKKLANQSTQEIDIRLIRKVNKQRHPAQILKRCGRQAFQAEIKQGLYFCLELKSGSPTAKGFLADNDVFAEIFYGLWNVAEDRAALCSEFNDTVVPLRGGKLLYTIHWRKKNEEASNGRFFTYSGIMYGQSKAD